MEVSMIECHKYSTCKKVGTTVIEITNLYVIEPSNTIGFKSLHCPSFLESLQLHESSYLYP